MAHAERLRAFLADIAEELPHDVAEMARRAAGLLGAHLDAGDSKTADAGALALTDHLFRGSAAAGALNQIHPAPAEPEEPEPAPVTPPKPAPAAPKPAAAPAAVAPKPPAAPAT